MNFCDYRWRAFVHRLRWLKPIDLIVGENVFCMPNDSIVCRQYEHSQLKNEGPSLLYFLWRLENKPFALHCGSRVGSKQCSGHWVSVLLIRG